MLWFLFAAVWALVAANELEAYGQPNGAIQDSLEILELIKFKNSHSECLRTALGSMLVDCRQHGVESLSAKSRKYLALKLTFCEMESLKLDLPSTCYNIYSELEMDICIAAVEKIPQYWTMFSGNYREIRKICYEESMPHQKDQILSVYTNITKVFMTLNSEMLKSSSVNEELHREFESKFDGLLAAMRDLTSDVFKSQKHMSQEFEKSNSAVKDSFENTLVLLQSFSGNVLDDVNELAVNLNFLKLEFQLLQQSFTELNVTRVFESLKGEVSEQYDDILETMDKAADKVVSKFEVLNGQADSRMTKEIQLHQSLSDNVELSSNLNSMLANIKVNAEHHIQALVANNENEYNFIRELLNGLENLFEQIDTRLDQCLEKIDDKTGEILAKIQDTNKELDSMLRFFQYGFKLKASLITWVNAVYNLIINQFQAFVSDLTNQISLGVMLTFLLVIRYYSRPTRLKRSKSKKRTRNTSIIIISFILSLIMFLILITWLILVDINLKPNSPQLQPKSSLGVFLGKDTPSYQR